MARVTFDDVAKVFGDGTTAVKDLTLAVGDGEFMVLVGPSGCGKTTALRMLAGLEDVSRGEIAIGDRVVNDCDARERDVAMVFQNYALYPHMNVFQNMAFGLRSRRVPKAEVQERVAAIARVLGLEDLLERKPGQLSGGQRQRVAMGRAIVREPSAFLMDEPLSNLDAKLRVQMRAEISRIQRELGATTVYVTHDQVEAMTMGDRVAVMRKGELQQVDHPQRLYDAPANLFVASFIGSPSMNFVEGQIARDGDALCCSFGGASVPLGPEHAALADYEGRAVGVGFRPEHVSIADGDAPLRLSGTAVLTESLGAQMLVHADVAGRALVADAVLEGLVDGDTADVAALRPDDSRVRVVAAVDPDAPVRPGQSIELALDAARLHCFDLESGRSIAAGRRPVAA